MIQVVKYEDGQAIIAVDNPDRDLDNGLKKIAVDVDSDGRIDCFSVTAMGGHTMYILGDYTTAYAARRLVSRVSDLYVRAGINLSKQWPGSIIYPFSNQEIRTSQISHSYIELYPDILDSCVNNTCYNMYGLNIFEFPARAPWQSDIESGIKYLEEGQALLDERRGTRIDDARTIIADLSEDDEVYVSCDHQAFQFNESDYGVSVYGYIEEQYCLFTDNWICFSSSTPEYGAIGALVDEEILECDNVTNGNAIWLGAQ